MSTDPKAITSPPPPASPELPRDPTDSSVSMFGSRTQFDGLGVIFDTSPTQPLYSRSDRRNWASTDMHHGLGASSGVVSGVLDDGSGQWLEPDTRVMKAEDEAAYLEKAIGECEGEVECCAPVLLVSEYAHAGSSLYVQQCSETPTASCTLGSATSTIRSECVSAS